MQAPFVVKAADVALAQATPEIINSDQGSQYTSPQYVELVTAAGSGSAWTAGTGHTAYTISSPSGCGGA